MFLCDFSLHHFMLKQDSIQVRALKVDDIKGSEVADKKVFFHSISCFLFFLSLPLSLSLSSLHTYTHTCTHNVEPQTVEQRQVYMKVNFSLQLGV